MLNIVKIFLMSRLNCFLILLLSIICFNSCKVSFNGGQKIYLEKQGIDLSKIQYYNSKSIILKRVVSSKETEVLSGTVTMQNGQMIEEIEIKKNTPGILTNSTENAMYIQFEPGVMKENYLIFELSPNKKFNLRHNEGKINYHQSIYRSVITQPFPELLIKKKISRAVTYKRRKAKGVKVN